MKKVLSVLVGATVLLGFAGAALAYTPLSYQVNYTDSGGPQTSNLSPVFSGTGQLFSTDPTTGEIKLINIEAGSGFVDTGTGLAINGLISDKVIAPDGNPLAYYITNEMPNIYASTSTVNSNFTTLSSWISSLGTPFNVSTFMSSEATSSLYLASTTANGFMSATMAAKLTALNASTSISYEGTTQRVNSFPIFKSVTVSSGTAVFNMTSDGTSGGTTLCPNGVIQDSVNPLVNDATASYQMSWTWSNSNKTLTVTANKLTTSNILTGILGQAAANAAVVKVTVWCY